MVYVRKFNFDPNQERDDHGRWVGTNGHIAGDSSRLKDLITSHTPEVKSLKPSAHGKELRIKALQEILDSGDVGRNGVTRSDQTQARRALRELGYGHPDQNDDGSFD